MLNKLKKLPIHTHFLIRTGLLIAAMIIMLFAQAASRSGTMNIGMAAGLVLMIIGSLWHILFLRCPHCGTLFHPRGGIPKHCPECGKYIDKFH